MKIQIKWIIEKNLIIQKKNIKYFLIPYTSFKTINFSIFYTILLHIQLIKLKKLLLLNYQFNKFIKFLFFYS